MDEIKDPLFGMMRRLGDQAAREFATKKDLGISDVRKCPIELIAIAFKTAQAATTIPKWAKMKAFRFGWRGPSNLANHGKASTYASGCRCDDCREGWRVYNKSRRGERKKEFERQQQEQVTIFTEGSAIALEMERLAILDQFLPGAD